MNLLEKLQKDFIIGDGGYGAIILSRGLSDGECEEAWNLTHPDDIEEMHRLFIEAGAEIIQANTLKANRLFLEKHGLEEKVRDLNRAGVEIAHRAAEKDGVFIGCSIGPIGEVLEPYGDLTQELAAAVFAEQAEALAEAKPDAIFIETFIDINEAVIAVEAAKKTGIPVVVSLSYQVSGATVMGVKPDMAATKLREAGADVIGANCGIGPVELFPIMEAWKKSGYDGLTIAQPNAGMPQLIAGKTVFPETPERMAEYAVKFRDIGINIIGGCCGTRPEHLRAMAKALRG